MATITHAAEIVGGANTTSYTTLAFIPAADDLLVVFVAGLGTRVAATMTSSVSGKTFSLVTSADFGGSSRLYVFVADQLASAESQTVTFDCTGDEALGATISVERIGGITRVGLDAILQSAVAALQNGVAPETVFAANALTGNPTLGAVANSEDTGVVEPTGWTELADVPHGGPACSLETVGRNSGFTGDTITWGSSEPNFSVISVEIDSSVEGGLTAVTVPNANTITLQALAPTAKGGASVRPGAVSVSFGARAPAIDASVGGGGGAGITFVGSATASTTDGSDPVIDLTEIVGLAEGDYVIVTGATFDDSFVGVAGVSTTGFNQIASVSFLGVPGAFAVERKIMGATPDSSVTCVGSGATNKGAAYVARAYRGVDTTTPEDVTPTTASGSVGTPDPPAIDPVTNDCMVVALAGNSRGSNGGASTLAAPSGYGNLAQDLAIASSWSFSVASADKLLSGSAAEDPGVFTPSPDGNGFFAAATIALRPAVDQAGASAIPASILVSPAAPTIVAKSPATVAAVNSNIQITNAAPSVDATTGAGANPPPAILTLDVLEAEAAADKEFKPAGVSVGEGVSFPEGVTDIRTTVGCGGTNDEGEESS